MPRENVPLIDLLIQLRKRLIIISVAVMLGMGIAWNLSPAILKFIERPLTGPTYLTELKGTAFGELERRFPDLARHFQHPGPLPEAKRRQLNYTAPLEPFFVQCTIALIAGIILALPVVFHQAWHVVAPLLNVRRRNVIVPIIVAATAAFCSGVAFFLWVIWPVIIDFSLSYETGGLNSWFNLNTYVNFCLRLIFIFGLIFELPMAALILARCGLLSGKVLAKNRKYALLASSIVSAFHADLLTMFVVMVPLYLMYEISVWVAYLFAGTRGAPVSAAAGGAGMASSGAAQS